VVRHEQGIAILLAPGSIEWASKPSPVERVDYLAGDLKIPRPDPKFALERGRPIRRFSVSTTQLTHGFESTHIFPKIFVAVSGINISHTCLILTNAGATAR
jgi:hypothetical protein